MPKRKILLADDQPGLRHLVSATLGSDAYQLLQAGDGVEALAVARRELPDLILLDIDMPKLNGLEVCRQLKADPAMAAIKIVMLTAALSDQDRWRSREVGADDYFTKPFSPLALLNKVREILG